MNNIIRTSRAVPSWVPQEIQNYVFHTEMGQPIRVLARSQSCHASTIMRQIRKVETRRDDPLIDRAIKALAQESDQTEMPTDLEMMQALRRLSAPEALLAIAMGMAQGVILQDIASGEPDHGSKLPADTAMTLALRGWIACGSTTGRVLRYRITPTGRTALRELTAATENQARAMAEAPEMFEHAPKGVGTWGTAGASVVGGVVGAVVGGAGGGTWADTAVPARMPLQESPIVGLSRRRDRDGNPFLNRAMVRASERLREDFELAQVATQRNGEAAPNWQDILEAINSSAPLETAGTNAFAQVKTALVFLGPGLSEVAVRCCCYLEGLETTEKQMGWAARSGKVVLRIALQRLVLHYENIGQLGPKIG